MGKMKLAQGGYEPRTYGGNGLKLQVSNDMIYGYTIDAIRIWNGYKDIYYIHSDLPINSLVWSGVGGMQMKKGFYGLMLSKECLVRRRGVGSLVFQGRVTRWFVESCEEMGGFWSGTNFLLW